jgi:hypothetical protein
MSVEFTTLVQIDYDGSNLMYQQIVKYHDFYISHLAFLLKNYRYIYSSDLSPFAIDSDNYRIDFNSTSLYDRNSVIDITDKDNSYTTKLSVSTDFIESIRDHVLENRSLNINERQARSFEGLLPVIDNRLNYGNTVNVENVQQYQQYQQNNGFEPYNINQMLNSSSAVRSTQNRINVRVNNITDPTINPTNNNDPVEINQNGSGLRKTKKKQRKNKRKTRIRK